MELEAVILKRHSVRKFRDDVSPGDGVLNDIIELARHAPSAGAIRGYKVFISQEKLSRYNAPVYIVICKDREAYASRYGDRGRYLYALQDATIFGAYLQLILVNRGLASVWIGAFKEDKIRQILGTDLCPIAIIAVGYELS